MAPTLRKKMIWSILLLLITLTSCVSGSFVEVTQNSYQAEENQDVTLEWPFNTRTDGSIKPIHIVCEMYDGDRHVVLLELRVGDKVSQPQDKRFQFELIQGRLRLNISRPRTNDSSFYQCTVNTGGVQVSRKYYLNVTAERVRPKPETPNSSSGGRNTSTTGSPSQAESPGLIVLYCVVVLMIAGTLLGGYYCLRRKQNSNTVL